MSAPIAGLDQPIVIQSLFRYFAHDQQLLQAIWRSMGPTIKDDHFHRQAGHRSVAAHTQRPCGPPSLPVSRVDELRHTRDRDRFTTAICRE